MHFEKYDRLRYEYTYVPIWAISTLFESNMKIAISTEREREHALILKVQLALTS